MEVCVIIHYLLIIILGFIIGIISGLFGVGGGFLLVPLLTSVFNIPCNIAIGSSLCQMIGTSTASTLKHRTYGNVDYRLAMFILIGSISGAELGAQILMFLKNNTKALLINNCPISQMDFWVNLIYLFLLSLIGISMFMESRKAKKSLSLPPEEKLLLPQKEKGVVKTVFSQKIQNIKIPPLVSLPTSQIESISIWNLILLGLFTGMISGLLGIGGAFIMNPALIYLIGVPTSVAVGTSLFQTIFIALYGTLTHFVKGNINFILVANILLGSLIGSQLGAKIHSTLKGRDIRYYFSLVIFVAVAIVLIKFLLRINYL